jgi:hypothetical protein
MCMSTDLTTAGVVEPHMSEDELLKAAGHEAFQEEKVVTTSDGQTFPFTMMGMQLADMHEASLHRIRRKSEFRLSLTLGDWDYWLTRNQFGVSKTNRYKGGSMTWHPVHIGWTKKAAKGRHFTVKFRPDNSTGLNTSTRVR